LKTYESESEDVNSSYLKDLKITLEKIKDEVIIPEIIDIKKISADDFCNNINSLKNEKNEDYDFNTEINNLFAEFIKHYPAEALEFYKTIRLDKGLHIEFCMDQSIIEENYTTFKKTYLDIYKDNQPKYLKLNNFLSYFKPHINKNMDDNMQLLVEIISIENPDIFFNFVKYLNDILPFVFDKCLPSYLQIYYEYSLKDNSKNNNNNREIML